MRAFHPLVHAALLSLLALGLTTVPLRADGPVELSADSSSFDKGLMIAEGKATFRDGTVVIHCNRIEYDTMKKFVLCVGPADVEINGVIIFLVDPTYDLAAKRITAGNAAKKE